uniref:Uncharacterized protein n=1 Tax=Mesocestoides corti TaxID=53468 RepID=A0A5K3FVW4_MESCO
MTASWPSSSSSSASTTTTTLPREICARSHHSNDFTASPRPPRNAHEGQGVLVRTPPPIPPPLVVCFSHLTVPAEFTTVHRRPKGLASALDNFAALLCRFGSFSLL